MPAAMARWGAPRVLVAGSGHSAFNALLDRVAFLNAELERRVQTRTAELEAAKLPATLMVDFSHANSSKQHEKQLDVARDIAGQIAGGSSSVFGVMIESHLNAGAQKFTPGKDDAGKLEYGKSITDACLGWGDSVQALQVLSDAVKARRSR